MKFDRLASTNDFALDILSKSRPLEGTVIIADDQYAGKGQFGSSWHSETGQNCTFSIILYPGFLPVTDVFLLNMAISLGLVDAMKDMLPDIEWCIKWPNDIMGNGKKVGGILIRNTIRKSNLDTTVAGIGINVNQTSFPGLPGASSLSLLAEGNHYKRDEVLQTVLFHLERYYSRLKNALPPERLFTELKNSYLQHSYKYNTLHLFIRPDSTPLEARMVDVDPTGRLILENLAGKREHFLVKEIDWNLSAY